ncbi:MAG TPA: phosphoenolpyruvate carboxykinase (ATP), partial [Candidatus Sulfotelmatobacter sp.]|nr:phosphoenolpyruvate carboxykinase (ATP) [Candidatus Sulfotelmatobacter sp.]
VGQRIRLPHTRAILRAALDGVLDEVPTRTDPIFGLAAPTVCPGVPPEILQARAAWADPVAYDARATELASLFRKNFEQFKELPGAVVTAGPRA